MIVCAAISCQLVLLRNLVVPLIPVLLHIMKNVALNPYLSKIGLAYMKSPLRLSSKDSSTTLLKVATPPIPVTLID
ncbi:MAG: hypothetical protein M3Y53_01930, partial [Thermoproteota archaeon]|nr:hypothetical protein [Thermoproteota archaeon]